MSKEFKDGFTSKADDWELFYTINDLMYKQAREIEAHIKRMKSRKYIEDLKRYDELTQKLIANYTGKPI